MGVRRAPRGVASLFRFDRAFLNRFQLVAGVDEAGRGPLAGPVVAAAVILPFRLVIPELNDSKQLSAAQRARVFCIVQRRALAIGVGIVDHQEIDRLNILRATHQAMRQALASLMIFPAHVLVDGYPIPNSPVPQTGVIGGDARSACIAAASIVAKVTRDSLMAAWHTQYPEYGFGRHKGYGTRAHLAQLQRLGPCAIHRRSFAPVRRAEPEPVTA